MDVDEKKEAELDSEMRKFAEAADDSGSGLDFDARVSDDIGNKIKELGIELPEPAASPPVPPKPKEDHSPEPSANSQSPKPEVIDKTEDGKDPAPAVLDEKPPETDPKEPDPDKKKEPEPEPDPEKGKISKFAKEMARREKSWQALQDDRKALEQEREELRLEKAAMQDTKPDPDKPDYSAAEYDSIAAEFEGEGRADLAKVSRLKAERAREYEAGQTTKQQEAKFRQEWDANTAKVIEANPDLKDISSPLYKVASHIIANKPALRSYPEGVIDAVEAAKNLLAAQNAGVIQKQVDQQKVKIDELEKKLSVGGSPQPQPLTSGTKTFEDMDDKEQDAYLLRQAEAQERKGDGVPILG